MGENILEREVDAFMKQLPSMLGKNEGKYVVFHGDENLGYWHCEMDAIKAGYEELGNVPFLVREVRSYGTRATFTRSINSLSA